MSDEQERQYEQATAGVQAPRPLARWGLVAVFGGVGLGLMVILTSANFGKSRGGGGASWVQVGKRAPTFTLRRMDNGAPFSFEQLRGRPAVINFWASWCAPCRSEHGVLQWAAQRFGTQAQFVGIVFEDADVNASRFLRENGVTFPQLTDPESRTAVAYGVTGVPETFFVDADGKIHGKHVGPITQEAFLSEVKSILEDGAQ